MASQDLFHLYQGSPGMMEEITVPAENQSTEIKMPHENSYQVFLSPFKKVSQIAIG